MDADSPFAAGDAPVSSPSDLPQVMDLLSETFRRVQEDFASIFVAGVAPMVATLVGTFVGIALVYGLMFLAMMPGLASNDEDLAAIGAMGGALGGALLLMAGMLLVIAPMQASLYRAMWAYLVHDEPLTFGSAFGTFTQDIVKVYVFNVVLITGVMVGMMFCYLPGLLVLMALSLAAPAIYVHRLSIGDGIRLSVSHVTEHFTWHVGFYGIAFAMQLILQYIPIVGYALLMTVVPLYTLLAYRALFGDGDAPRGYATL